MLAQARVVLPNKLQSSLPVATMASNYMTQSDHHAKPTYSPVQRDRNPWSPGILARLPRLGIGALFGTLLGIAASIGILVASDNQPVSSWRYQPTVYLAIASTLTNILLHFALAEAVNVAWWVKTLRNRTSVEDLHVYWINGNSLWAALTAGRKFNLVALACIVTSVAPVNGPLLQRASTIATQSQVSQPILKMNLAPEIPQGFSGYISGRALEVSLFTANFTPTVQDFTNRATITTTATGCEGMCNAKAIGAGFAVNCSSYPFPFDLRPSPTGGVDQSTTDGTQAFLSDFTWNGLFSGGNISLNVQYKDSTACNGDLVVKNCSLRAATVQYPVIIDNNNSSISLDPSTTIFDDIVGPIQSIPLETEFGPSTLGGVNLALHNRWASEAHLRFVGAVGYELLNTGATANAYTVVEAHANKNFSISPGSSCGLFYENPVPDLLKSARELMFRTALAAANISTIQYVPSTQRSTRLIYESHYLFLGIATAISVIAVLAVSCTFHGYWRLGRTVSMSPLETARAFAAPLLKEGDSNGNAKEMLKEHGAMLVKYGAIASAAEYGRSTSMRLEVADPQSVRVPQKGTRFEG